MKQLLGIILLSFLFSCNNSKPTISNKRDTGVVAYAPNGTTNYQNVLAVFGQCKKYAYDDTTSNEYHVDTTLYFVWQAIDTMRNATTRKPIYDSANKRYTFQYNWIPVDKKALSGMKFKIIEKTSK
jgi:hypothetical protein